jgi:hypothetical protein
MPLPAEAPTLRLVEARRVPLRPQPQPNHRLREMVQYKEDSQFIGCPLCFVVTFYRRIILLPQAAAPLRHAKRNR